MLQACKIFQQCDIQEQTITFFWNHDDSLSLRQLAYMLAAAQSKLHKLMSFEYPHWSLALEAMVRTIKEQVLEQPVCCQFMLRAFFCVISVQIVTGRAIHFVMVLPSTEFHYANWVPIGWGEGV